MRRSAAEALGNIGTEAKTALPQLIPLLQDSNAQVHSSAVFALAKIGAEPKTVVPPLVPLLQDSYPDVSSSAAEALGKIGAPQLIFLLFDANVRSSAASALVSLYIKPAIQNPYIWGLGIYFFLVLVCRPLYLPKFYRLRIKKHKLLANMRFLVNEGQKKHLFNDTELLNACQKLSTIVGNRNITVFLAKLYADQLVAEKKGTTDGNLPENLSELILHHLNQLNAKVSKNKISDITVQQDAKIIAWECLKQTYRCAPANRQNVMNALGEEDAESRIKYLEYKLKIIKKNGINRDKIRFVFVLDSLAEYLAALYLLDINGTDESKWQDFLDTADFQKSPKAIKGFLLTLKDCYLDKIPGAKDTDFLPKKIAARYNVLITVPPQSP